MFELAAPAAGDFTTTTRYVALDTETTGRDPDADEVIEVGAVAFDLEGATETYQTFVRPYRLPDYQVERLTGIRAADLESAPRFASVAGELREFIGSSPLVGQNIAFDLAFLERGGVVPPGAAIDTFELAQLLLPGLSDYSLRGLAAHLGIEFPVRHRALADAEASRLVFLALRQRLAELPSWLLEQVGRLAAAGGWSLAAVIADVLAAGGGAGDGRAGASAEELLAPAGEPPRPLQAIKGAAPASDTESLRLLSLAASLPEHFGAGFERRLEQEEMAAAVSRSLRERHHLVVEAGTGVGKSLAYLLPAALHAVRTGERVVVSTDTLGLQEQLFAKDLPVVQELVRRAEGQELRTAQLKGRRNYLCLQRWSASRFAPPATKEEAILQARLLVWLTRTQTGDRAELGLHSSFEGAWSKLSAEDTACLTNGCSFARSGACFLLRARRRAEAAHILVVNHALLLTDIATGGHVLPAYSRLVVDEAHNLEDEATSRLAFRASEGDVAAFLDRIGRRAGDRGSLVHSLQEAARGSGEVLGPGAYIAGVGSALLDAAGRARQRLSTPFRLLNRVLREHGASDRETEERLLITRATRVQPLWSDVQIAAEDLHAALRQLAGLLADVHGLLESAGYGLMDQEGLTAEVAGLWQEASSLMEGLGAALLSEDASLICWLERERGTGEVAVCTAPLQVSEILRRELFERKDSVVLTSATLSAEGSFAYLRERVGLDEAEELLLGSPFDYPESTLIVLPRDLPEPNDREYALETAELLVEACRASGGRALLLFTSYGSLMAAYEQIKAPLESEGILVLAHGVDGSPRQLLAALRENNRTVLLGTASFWEGVDVAGEALSLLVIARLPFAVPTDPIYQARSALYDEPFDQYALPQAVLRFRQGFGRLIRSRTDRGVLLVLDTRIRSRKYGEAFLRSLPRCTVRDLAAREVPGAIEAWLSRPPAVAAAGRVEPAQAS
ncbi:MAG TPA: helicase C-terminal domain-containing protein [Dehalococcoidia bacterium]|nr:helicase C-terminal domain-containing protein [Dehalococcoidia bacterium]